MESPQYFRLSVVETRPRTGLSVVGGGGRIVVRLAGISDGGVGGGRSMESVAVA